MKKILLNGVSLSSALVDDEDYEMLNKYKWYYKEGYAVRYISQDNRNTVPMHQLLVTFEKTDHEDTNKLNNQKHNLRECTHQQNMMNKGKQSNNTTGYKGVTWWGRTSKWRARISLNGRLIHLGLFDTKEEAALAYNKGAIKYHGEFANLNNV